MVSATSDDDDTELEEATAMESRALFGALQPPFEILTFQKFQYCILCIYI